MENVCWKLRDAVKGYWNNGWYRIRNSLCLVSAWRNGWISAIRNLMNQPFPLLDSETLSYRKYRSNRGMKNCCHLPQKKIVCKIGWFYVFGLLHMKTCFFLMPISDSFYIQIRLYLPSHGAGEDKLRFLSDHSKDAHPAIYKYLCWQCCAQFKLRVPFQANASGCYDDNVITHVPVRTGAVSHC